MQLRAKRDPEIDSLVQAFLQHYNAIFSAQESTEAEKALAQKMMGYVACWDAESETVAGLSGETAGFTQQGSGIDVIFSAYLWAFKMGCRNYDQFSELNGLLVGISQSPQGKAKTKKMLQEMGTQLAMSLVGMLSKSTEMHLPPFVLNNSRLYDLVAIFGAFPLDDVRCEQLDGYSCSPRYVLNLRRNSGEGLALIGKSWELWKATFGGSPGEAEISESEHLFHQFLLRKHSPFQNTHRLKSA
ncbi:hypothetical protein HPB47_017984 [Ixodes persulcatus]|uniref:Uncharacterized protein n=1 Tax=Ixodes persulcatus TaxID=34615 RepID=A0AC60QMV8_IXOPE|nr:hypothetical protein HPB47_017984 [Ixodes persulcatus]